MKSERGVSFAAGGISRDKGQIHRKNIKNIKKNKSFS